jgi:toxin ParE1/3/4
MRRLPVEYRRSAVDDLLDITAHILDQSQNIISTESYANRIWARCGKIGDAPLGGVAREDLGPGIRMDSKRAW